jgi:hypothetical protein
VAASFQLADFFFHRQGWKLAATNKILVIASRVR